MNRTVKWDNIARLQLREAYNYIKKDSLVNSEKVRKEILSASRLLAAHPEKYPADKYKLSNDGSYRAFELYHYRIAYRILKIEIKIISLRHTSMEPLDY